MLFFLSAILLLTLWSTTDLFSAFECSELAEVGQGSKDSGNQLFASIVFPPPNTAQWEEQVCEKQFPPNYLKLIYKDHTCIICLTVKIYEATLHIFISQIRRLYLLLTVKESATDVPTNLEARRRITFFANSLFMDMPRAPRVRKMLSFRCSVVLLVHAIYTIIFLYYLVRAYLDHTSCYWRPAINSFFSILSDNIISLFHQE